MSAKTSIPVSPQRQRGMTMWSLIYVLATLGLLLLVAIKSVPVYLTAYDIRETIEWAAHPDRKYTYLQNFNPWDAAVKYLNYYRQVAQDRYGYEAASSQMASSPSLRTRTKAPFSRAPFVFVVSRRSPTATWSRWL